MACNYSANGVAKARETGVSLTQPVARQQALHYYIPPGGLSGVWDYVVQNLRAPEFFDLADPVLLINAKNMKTMFREDTPQKLIQSFHARWESSFDSTAFHPGSTWIDIGKETVFPNRSSEGTASTPHVYLWRQKCLEPSVKTLYELLRRILSKHSLHIFCVYEQYWIGQIKKLRSTEILNNIIPYP
ncbi:hypothetical protein BDZ91DRAFT_72865 [Kalaharituber pfeilii]|nr:hypothetical protein BDZ91DRAFT_72865 [Kalaharituber pfeilii]